MLQKRFSVSRGSTPISLVSASGGLQVVSLFTPSGAQNKNRHFVTKSERQDKGYYKSVTVTVGETSPGLYFQLAHGRLLLAEQGLDPGTSEPDHRLKLIVIKNPVLGGRLKFDESSC